MSGSPQTARGRPWRARLVGDFDPDTYRSDRKDQSVQAFTLAAPAAADKAGALKRRLPRA